MRPMFLRALFTTTSRAKKSCFSDYIKRKLPVTRRNFATPWTVTKSYQRSRRPKWIEAVCAEQNQYVVIGKENYFISLDGHLMPVRAGQPPPDLRFFDKPADR